MFTNVIHLPSKIRMFAESNMIKSNSRMHFYYYFSKTFIICHLLCKEWHVLVLDKLAASVQCVCTVTPSVWCSVLVNYSIHVSVHKSRYNV